MDAFGGKRKIVVDVVKRRRRVHALQTCAMYRPRLHIGILLDFPVSKYGKVGVLPSSEFKFGATRQKFNCEMFAEVQSTKILSLEIYPLYKSIMAPLNS